MKLCGKLAFLAILAAIYAGCNLSDEKAVPRRTAYPRLEPYADSTVTAHSGGLSFDIKAGADTSSRREGWLDIIYPRYRATLHVTVRRLASPDELQDAIANRRQRMSLNLGDRTAMASEFENNTGFICRIMTSLDGGPTPVQFTACRADGYLVSGATVIAGTCEPADSIAPTTQALAADVEILLKSLR